MQRFLFNSVLALALATGMAWTIQAQDQPKPKQAKVVYSMPVQLPLKVTGQWGDIVLDKSLRTILPEGYQFISDELTWILVWDAWRGAGNPPAVNFKEEVLLVFTSLGPNIPCLNLYRVGNNVTGKVFHTLIGGPGFGYRILKVSRKEVKYLFGQSID